MREVYDGVLAAAPAGALLIDLSTIDIGAALRCCAGRGGEGASHGDAPVSGGVADARAATLTFMVGGPEAAFARRKERGIYANQRIIGAMLPLCVIRFVGAVQRNPGRRRGPKQSKAPCDEFGRQGETPSSTPTRPHGARRGRIGA